MSDTLFVLLKWTERRDADPNDVVVHGVFHSREEVDEKLDRIAAANAQYKLRPTMRAGGKPPIHYVIGPTEDEGFFGNSPVHLLVRQHPARKVVDRPQA